MSGSGGRSKKEGWLGGVDAIALFMRDQLPGIKGQLDGLITQVDALKDAFKALGEDVDYPALATAIGITLEVSVMGLRVSIWLTTGAVWGLTEALKAIKRIGEEEVGPAIGTLASLFTDVLAPALGVVGRIVADPVIWMFGSTWKSSDGGGLACT
jgi:hypothetical protein